MCSAAAEMLRGKKAHLATFTNGAVHRFLESMVSRTAWISFNSPHSNGGSTCAYLTSFASMVVYKPQSGGKETNHTALVEYDCEK